MSGTLGEYLDQHGYGTAFREWYLEPMAACIWSHTARSRYRIPAEEVPGVLQNHGLISVNDRPKWRTVKGGARHYVNAIAAQLPDVRLGAEVTRLASIEASLKW